jgi:hypothetical protein
MARLIQIPAWKIIIVFTAIGFVVPFVLGLGDLASKFGPPKQLAPLPTPSKAIRGFDASGFFQADPYIETVDGQIYAHEWDAGGYTWQASQLHPALKNGDACSSDIVERIENSSTTIIDCQTIRTIGEWCPGNVVSIAITENGVVWELIEQPPCYFFTFIFLTLTVPAGFFLGILLAGGKRIALFIMTKRASGRSS